MNFSPSNNSYLALEKVKNLQNEKRNLPKRKKTEEKKLQREKQRVPKRKKLAGNRRITPADSEISEESNTSDVSDSSDSDTEPEVEPTLSAGSLKLFRILLENAELGLQKLSKYFLIRLIEDCDPDISTGGGSESSEDSDAKSDTSDNNTMSDNEKLTKRQISHLRLIIKSAGGKAKILTKSMLINLVKHVE